MTSMYYKIKDIRKTPAFQSLISVNEQMGYPCDIDGIVFIPFFVVKKNGFELSSEVFFDRVSYRIIKFQRILKSEPVNINRDELYKTRNKTLEQGVLYGIKDVPACMKQIYIKAEEEINHDRC